MQDNIKLDVHLSKAYVFDVNIYHKSAQVIRFNIKCGIQEMNLEKRLLEKRQPWKVIASNFKMDKPDTARNFNIICQCLDEAMKGPSVPYVHPKNY